MILIGDIVITGSLMFKIFEVRRHDISKNAVLLHNVFHVVRVLNQERVNVFWLIECYAGHHNAALIRYDFVVSMGIMKTTEERARAGFETSVDHIIVDVAGNARD